MITAVDSSVILDVLTGDQDNASASLAALRKASREGRLIVSESVIAEVRPGFESNSLFEEFLGDWGLEFTPSTLSQLDPRGRDASSDAGAEETTGGQDTAGFPHRRPRARTR